MLARLPEITLVCSKALPARAARKQVTREGGEGEAETGMKMCLSRGWGWRKVAHVQTRKWAQVKVEEFAPSMCARKVWRRHM